MCRRARLEKRGGEKDGWLRLVGAARGDGWRGNTGYTERNGNNDDDDDDDDGDKRGKMRDVPQSGESRMDYGVLRPCD